MSDEPTTTPPGEPAAEPEPVIERWIYGGVRPGSGGRKLALWIDEAGEDHLFAHESGPTVGSVYEVKVTRAGTATMHGEPRYAGRCEDDDKRNALIAADIGMRAWFDLKRREKQDKADNPMWELCDRLAGLLNEVPSPQRHLAIYAVFDRISRQSWRR